jgi:hypothetical protein
MSRYASKFVGAVVAGGALVLSAAANAATAPTPWITPSPQTVQTIRNGVVTGATSVLGSAYGPPYVGSAIGRAVGTGIVNYMNANPVPMPSLAPPAGPYLPYGYTPPGVPQGTCALIPSYPGCGR